MKFISRSYNPKTELNKDTTKGSKRITGVKFITHQFGYLDSKSYDIETLELTYDFNPSKSIIKKDLELLKDNYKKGYEFNEFTPKLTIKYPFVFGYTTGYKVYLTTKETSEYENRMFADEIDKNNNL